MPVRLRGRAASPRRMARSRRRPSCPRTLGPRRELPRAGPWPPAFPWPAHFFGIPSVMPNSIYIVQLIPKKCVTASRICARLPLHLWAEHWYENVALFPLVSLSRQFLFSPPISAGCVFHRTALVSVPFAECSCSRDRAGQAGGNASSRRRKTSAKLSSSQQA